MMLRYTTPNQNRIAMLKPRPNLIMMNGLTEKKVLLLILILRKV